MGLWGTPHNPIFLYVTFLYVTFASFHLFLFPQPISSAAKTVKKTHFYISLFFFDDAAK